MEKKQFCVYIMASKTGSALYVGMTSNLKRRAWQHRTRVHAGHTKNYNITKLVYYELCADARSAIAREKQLKGGPRQKKEDLINSMNPDWRDLYDDL